MHELPPSGLHDCGVSSDAPLEPPHAAGARQDNKIPIAPPTNEAAAAMTRTFHGGANYRARCGFGHARSFSCRPVRIRRLEPVELRARIAAILVEKSRATSAASLLSVRACSADGSLSP